MRETHSALGHKAGVRRSALGGVAGPSTERRTPNACCSAERRAPSAELWIVRLGLLPYGEALELQRAVARARMTGEIEQDVLLLVEHPPVVTLGRASRAANLIASPDWLRQLGVELFEVERGGDVTFHGPGQLVGYPVIDLKRHRQDLHWYLRRVEEALIRALGEFSITAVRHPGRTGVWTSETERKIASIGVHARDWVTWHGFALNVTTDLSYFDLIVPCGIEGVIMTSIACELQASSVDMAAVEEATAKAFGAVFSLTPTPLDRSAVRALAAPLPPPPVGGAR